jgi:hypothetical protein
MEIAKKAMITLARLVLSARVKLMEIAKKAMITLARLVLSARVKQMEIAKKAMITLARLVHKRCRLCKGEQIQHGWTQYHGRTDSTWSNTTTWEDRFNMVWNNDMARHIVHNHVAVCRRAVDSRTLSSRD